MFQTRILWYTRKLRDREMHTLRFAALFLKACGDASAARVASAGTAFECTSRLTRSSGQAKFGLLLAVGRGLHYFWVRTSFLDMV